MIEGSGSVPLTNGSGSGSRRPNNIRILLVRTDLMKGSGFLGKLWQLGEIRGHVQAVQGHTRAKRVTCAESQCAGMKCAERIAQERINVSTDRIPVGTRKGYVTQNARRKHKMRTGKQKRRNTISKENISRWPKNFNDGKKIKKLKVLSVRQALQAGN